MAACPHPEKVAHRTFDAAMRARDSLEGQRGIDLALRPYRCVCGRWHLGHKAVSLTSELRTGRKNAKTTARRRKR